MKIFSGSHDISHCNLSKCKYKFNCARYIAFVDLIADKKVEKYKDNLFSYFSDPTNSCLKKDYKFFVPSIPTIQILSVKEFCKQYRQSSRTTKEMFGDDLFMFCLAFKIKTKKTEYWNLCFKDSPFSKQTNPNSIQFLIIKD